MSAPAASPAASSPPAAPFDFAPIRPIFVGLLIGMFAASISMTIAGPAIPVMVADLGGVEHYSWLSTIVMLVSAIITPIAGKLSDMYGRRTFYILGLIIFMVGSALSGAAMSFGWLIFSRALQGVGMGILMPLSQTIIGDIIPPRQRGKYQGYMGAVMGFSQVAGPLIGGWITDALHWRWLFYVNLPIGVIALVIIVRNLKVTELRTRGKLDTLGISLMTVAVSALLLVITLGGVSVPWTSPALLALAAVGVVALVAFVWNEIRVEEPIVPLRLFRNPVFTFSNIAAFVMNATMVAVLIYVPVYAQGVLGLSPTESGAILIPMNIGVIGMGITVGLLITRTGHYKEFALAGIAIMFVGAILMTRLGISSESWHLSAATAVFGAGLGMAFQIYLLVVQNSVRRRDLGVATSTTQFFRNIGNTLGTAVAGALMTTGLVQGLDTYLTPQAAAEMPPEGLDPNLVMDPEALSALPDSVAIVMRRALDDAMHDVFLLIPVLVTIIFVATLFIRAVPLRDTVHSAEEAGKELLDNFSQSSVDPAKMGLGRSGGHPRTGERVLGLHLLLLAEQIGRRDESLLDRAVAELGDGDRDAGRALLRNSGAMLLTEDPERIDTLEDSAVLLSSKGADQRTVLGPEVRDRLAEIAARASQVDLATPSQPNLSVARAVSLPNLERVVSALDTVMLADIAASSTSTILPRETREQLDEDARAAIARRQARLRREAAERAARDAEQQTHREHESPDDHHGRSDGERPPG